MTNNKPEVVADIDMLRGQERRYASLRGDIDPYSLNDGDELIRLSDYEALQADYERLRKHLQSLIDQTTPLVPEPGNPMWSRRIQLDEVIAERDNLRAEYEKLLKDVEALVEALESLMKGYASLLEGGIDRITHLDGSCYLISDMLQGAREALAAHHKQQETSHD